MPTKTEHALQRAQRTGVHPPAVEPKLSRRVRTDLAPATAKSLPPTKSVRGSERAERMKSATASSRNGRRGG